ncbi:MAG: exodeoxyribonuclease V subunit gamma [Candidatus Cyclonatronum sp.]|uniref:exodeoxyribonuclease V subunit gamma n=1 Tax=Cyclonatronum sp. TaxID=3024185 RepID=UPI0025C10B78|nr:exodeoxyribonuclease V subunit gamma [Cyclonatronum sp.]MCH8487079.1 exodeoxyribonuclease V subunit gamma [Cyclonatronum sp.]
MKNTAALSAHQPQFTAMPEIISACRLEDLFAAFEDRLRVHAPPSVLAADTLLVPNRDIARWLQIRLARHQGIAANLNPVLPARFIHELNLQLDPGYEQHLPDKHQLAWMIFALTGKLPDAPVYQPLRDYLKKSGTGLEIVRRYELSANIADIFDQYQLFRPEWIAAWNRGERAEIPDLFEATAAWQQQLWTDLRSWHPQMTDRPALHERLMAAIDAGHLQLPHALHVFGTAPLPPLYLQAVLALGRHIPLLFYRILPETEGVSGPEHPLMAKLGEEHRQYAELLHGLTAGKGFQRQFVPVSTSPETSETERACSLLHCLQESVRRRETIPHTNDPADESLLVHACHSPMREVEVLHDRIIRFLDENPDAGPSDVLVVAPQLSDHLTAVNAVFGHPSDESLRLPWFIHDPSASPLVRASELLMQLLRIDESRFRADFMLGLLDQPLIRERLGLDDDDLRLIAFWVRETGIRWGLDEAFRGDDGLFSWQFGLDRLLLGLMQPADTAEPVLELMPFPHIEGEDQLRVAGQLSAFLEALASWVQLSSEARKLAEWPPLVRGLMAQLFPQTPDTDRFIQPLLRAVDRLPEAAAWLGDEALPVAVIAEALSAQIRQQTAGAGYRKGAVTFSAMVPVRHMPFRFIAVLGLNEGSFPGREDVSGFDLMARSPQPGDRIKRLSNRALFLDALMACRQQLHLSYIGFSFRDGSQRAPSLVLRELYDQLRAHGLPAPEDQLLVSHRLHGHHPAYFAPDENGRLFSYDAARIAALKSGRFAEISGDAQARFDQPAAAPDAENLLVVELKELISFVKQPVGWMMQNRANMRRLYEEELPAKRDPFALDALERYKLNGRLMQAAAAGEDAELVSDQMRRVLALEAQLPYRQAGDRAFDDNWRQLTDFLDAIPGADRDQALADNVLAETELEVLGRRMLLRGVVPPVLNGRSVAIEHGSMKPKRELTAWVRQLLVQCALDGNATGFTYTPDKNEGAVPLILWSKNPQEQLQRLLGLWLSTRELPPPATPNFLSLLAQYFDAADDKQAAQKRKLESYFKESQFSYDTLPNDDPWAALFYPEFEDSMPDEALPFYEIIWKSFQESKVEGEDE